MSSGGNKSRRGMGNVLAPARFIAFMVMLPVIFVLYLGIFPHDGWPDALAVSFDLSALAFLISVAPLLNDNDPGAIRDHALANDANRELDADRHGNPYRRYPCGHLG